MDESSELHGLNTVHLVTALVALGVSSIATQIVLLWEFLSVFYGNELVIGIVLASWMLLTGAGSLLGRSADRFGVRTIALALMALGTVPTMTVMLLRILRNVVFTSGSMIGIVQAFFCALVLLAPFCIISGFSFSLFAASLSKRRGGNLIALAYSWESLGSAAGGVLFSLALIPTLGTVYALLVLLAFDLTVAIVLAWKSKARFVGVLAGVILCMAVLLGKFVDLEAATRQFLFPGQNLVYFKDTPYGSLTVTQQGGQMNVFENNVLMFSTNDVTSVEENVHYAMVQHPSPKRVLLIGGGISGTCGEILKYGVERVDYAEMNPWIIGAGRKFTHALEDPRIRVIEDDARMYVRRTTERYDVALINLPDPETVQLNRFYTLEFFQELKRVLTESAVVSMSLLPAAEYQGPEARSISAVLYATLRRTFSHLLVVPGLRNYFIASDGPLDIGIGRLIEQRGITTTYVNRYYLDDRMLAERSAEITRKIDKSSDINTDFEPISYYRQLEYWLSYFGFSPGVWIFLGVAAVLLLLSRFSPVGLGIFAGGFAGSSMEIIILLALQTLCGSLYLMTGIVIASFMAGLATGSWLTRRVFPGGGIRMLISIQLVVSASCVLLPPLFLWLRGTDAPTSVIHLVFTILAFALAVLIGMEFAVASFIRGGSVAASTSELYGLDLAGSAVGALIVSVYAIPLFGVKNVSMLVGLVSAAGAAVCFVARKRYPARIGRLWISL
jgi:spermidine synthase